MTAQEPLRATEKANFEFFTNLPEVKASEIDVNMKNAQFLQPLFEFSGACAGCGETPIVKLLTQLYGDRMLIANATGCSSIYGANLPTTPYTTNKEGKGPAWANSLFEDNAEFGFGMLTTVEHKTKAAFSLLNEMTNIPADLKAALINNKQENSKEIDEQRKNVEALKALLPQTSELNVLADYLVRKDIWMLGGDGWAYDIGFSGIDHVLASGKRAKILVMDTESYSNTGGQQSKATPLGASAKFALAGRNIHKKDLGMEMMTFRHVYVAQIAFGANPAQAFRAITEAAEYNGPALIINYSHCREHGYDISKGLEHQKKAIESGHWLLYRYDPRRWENGEAPLQLDSLPLRGNLKEYMLSEPRFAFVKQTNEAHFEELYKMAEKDLADKVNWYQHLANLKKSS